MMFTLIKNEMIKILKKPKTWIVFGLFFLCLFGIGIVCKVNDENMRKVTDYDVQEHINSMDEQKVELEQEINQLESQNELNDINQKRLFQKQSELAQINEAINKEKEIINIPEDQKWKKQLESEKEQLIMINNSDIDSNSKSRNELRMKAIDNALKNNERIVEDWEFNAPNYILGFFETIGFVILILGIGIFMSDIVSGEATPPTLKFLLVQPVSRAKILFSKYLSVLIIVITMICGMELIGYGVVGAIKGFDGINQVVRIDQKYKYVDNDSPYKELEYVEDSGKDVTKSKEIIMSFGCQILFIIASVSFIFMISSIFKSSMISMGVSLIISVISSMLCMMSQTIGEKFAHLLFFNYGISNQFVIGNICCQFNNPNFSVNTGIIIMIVTSVVSYLVAHFVFTRKDMLI